MPIPMLDLERIHQPLENELQAAFQRVLSKNSFIMGEEVRHFESACEQYLNVKHAIGVSSGSDALLLALMCLDIQPGDEVICPTYTFFATAGAISRLGARPVFVDIDSESYNWDLEAVFAARTDKTRAVIPVHLFGACANMEGLQSWAQKHGIIVIEDAAQAIGAETQGKRAGSLGDFGCFSFFPSKNLGALGDGGLLVSNRDDLAEKARVLRLHGSKPKYYHSLVGGNFRLDALQAAFLGVKLPHLDKYTEQRQACALYYQEKIREFQLPVHFLQAEPDERHVFNQFVLRFETAALREQVRAAFQSAGIASAIYYPVPLHLQACFKELNYHENQFPIAEHAAETSLAIPIFPGIKPEEQDEVLATLKTVLDGHLALSSGV